MKNSKKDKKAATDKENQNINSLDQIKTLKELLEMGAITEYEFNTKKKELLGV